MIKFKGFQVVQDQAQELNTSSGMKFFSPLAQTLDSRFKGNSLYTNISTGENDILEENKDPGDYISYDPQASLRDDYDSSSSADSQETDQIPNQFAFDNQKEYAQFLDFLSKYLNKPDLYKNSVETEMKLLEELNEIVIQRSEFLSKTMKIPGINRRSLKIYRESRIETEKTAKEKKFIRNGAGMLMDKFMSEVTGKKVKKVKELSQKTNKIHSRYFYSNKSDRVKIFDSDLELQKKLVIFIYNFKFDKSQVEMDNREFFAKNKYEFILEILGLQKLDPKITELIGQYEL